MKKIAATMLAGAMLMTLAGSAAAGKAAVVFEDAVGDADNMQGTGQSAPGGFDLVSGSIAKVGANLQYTVTQNDMPPTGSGPEGFRLMWHINSGGEEYRFTVKSVDVGKPDAVAQSGTERVGQVYQGVARLEQCTETPSPAITLVNCNASEYYEAIFDVEAKTVTWEVPLASIKAKTGTVVAGGSSGASGTSCQICWVPHYAERSLTPSTVIDSATQTISYKVPKK